MKKTHSKYFLFLLLSIACISFSTHAATYDFESDTVGQTPTNVSVTAGTFEVQNEPLLGKSITATTQTGVIAGVTFTDFAGSADQSVVWKQAHTTTLGRGGFTLRAQAQDTGVANSAGAKRGYLFHVYDSNSVYIWKVGASSYSLLWSGTLSKAEPRWFKALVVGNQQGFYYSNDGTNYTLLASTTDSTYATGTVQYTAGYGAAVNLDYIDDVVITNHDHIPTTIYVNSSTGNDSTGNGTQGNPYATFSKGYTEAYSGDTLNLTGTFDWSDLDETGDVNDDGFVIQKNITIQGQSAASTFIQAASATFIASSSVFTIDTNATVLIKNVTIRNGAASYGRGGGAITNRGNLTLQYSVIRDNVFSSPSYGGAGGIYSGTAGETETFLTIATSTIYENLYTGTLYGAGAIFMESNNGILRIDDSTIATNTADSLSANAFPYSYAAPSGAIGARVATVYITNSTIYGNNTNSYGGALNLQLGDTTITNSTIVNNTASLGAGGVLVDSVTLNIMNTLIANNSANSQPNDFYSLDQNSSDMIVDNGYNIIEYSTNKTWNGIGDITGDQANLKLSDSLHTNGVSTGIQTLALLYGSVATNAGTSTTNNGVGTLIFDQRGIARNGVTDIGAFESYAVAPTPDPEVAPVVVRVTQTGSWSGPTGGGGTVVVPQVIATTSATSSMILFTKNLSLNMIDPEVKILQKFLNNQGYFVAISGPGSKGDETLKFGKATKTALIKFQKANNIKPASGYFGPITRGLMNVVK